MKTLLLVRHAKSNWGDSVIEDIDRPLKTVGIKDAYKMAERMKTLDVQPELIITSPAVRAISTALIIARKFNNTYEMLDINTIIYDFSKEAILQFVRNMDYKLETVMIVGHDPAITQLLNYFSGKNYDKIPTCSSVCIKFRLTHWSKVSEGNGKLIFIESPEKSN